MITEFIVFLGKLLKIEADNIFALEIRGKSYYQLGMFKKSQINSTNIYTS